MLVSMLRKKYVMNVAIPKINDTIASCFEAAKQFNIIEIEDGKTLSSKIIDCHGTEDFQRVRILRLYEISLLICNGTNRFYRDQLTSLGINVIPNINGHISTAIKNYLEGNLQIFEKGINTNKNDRIVSHDELIKWTKTLFEENGYSVFLSPYKNSTLIDLHALIKCPVCRKEIKVAICCGAQIYRLDQEIKEFYYSTKTAYQARVYVYLTDPEVEKSCNEYGITFISPDKNHKNDVNLVKYKIPIIQQPIEGHEKAFY